MAAPSGTFIAYSTKPGCVAQDGTGRNSPYTEEFLQLLDKPKLPLFDLFQAILENVSSKTNEEQEPWFTSSLKGKFYFNNK